MYYFTDVFFKFKYVEVCFNYNAFIFWFHYNALCFWTITLIFISWEDDHSRVVLKVDNAIPSDYINANYIDVSYNISRLILFLNFLKIYLNGIEMFLIFCPSLCILVFIYLKWHVYTFSSVILIAKGNTIWWYDGEYTRSPLEFLSL